VRRPDARDVPERAALCRVAAIVRDARATRFSRDSVRLDASLSRTLYGYLRVTTCLFSTMKFDAMADAIGVFTLRSTVANQPQICGDISPPLIHELVVVGPVDSRKRASALAVTIAS